MMAVQPLAQVELDALLRDSIWSEDRFRGQALGQFVVVDVQRSVGGLLQRERGTPTAHRPRSRSLRTARDGNIAPAAGVWDAGLEHLWIGSRCSFPLPGQSNRAAVPYFSLDLCLTAIDHQHWLRRKCRTTSAGEVLPNYDRPLHDLS